MVEGVLGKPGAGGIMDMPWDAAFLAGPQPPGLDNPLLLPPESPVWTLRFVMHHVHHKILGHPWYTLEDPIFNQIVLA